MKKPPSSAAPRSSESTCAKKPLSRRTFLASTSALAATQALGCTPPEDQEADEPGGKADDVTDKKIVRVAIHPAIGIARVGNSTATPDDDHIIGPEVDSQTQTAASTLRDASGSLKRQAARFRLYGYNAAGQVVSEIRDTDVDTEITWTVTLANKKAQWYQFKTALDIPTSPTVPRRNPSVADRASLAITPTPRSVSGESVLGPAFDDGRFRGRSVYLGELRTDADGRLLVLGGRGLSESPSGSSVLPFNNADGWYDDTSDGPVHATVEIAGETFEADSAWVVIGPPNFAPDVISFRSMYELMTDTFVAAGMLEEPAVTSFTRDVLPIFQRLTRLQWVNAGFLQRFGHGSEFDFEDTALIARLAGHGPSADDLDLRRQIFESFFPPPGTLADRRQRWPLLYGDTFRDGKPEDVFEVRGMRELHLRRWFDGDYIDDWDPSAPPAPASIDEVPIGDQPAMLDRAALHFCAADAFRPGAELTWPMRHASLYRAPYRIRERLPGEPPEPDFDSLLRADEAVMPGGPLEAQSAGDLTRWMAVPWQGDTVHCRSGYDAAFDPHLPTFWPAQVPNHVLSSADYDRVMDTALPVSERLAAFHQRASWFRTVTDTHPDFRPAIERAVQIYPQFGVVGVRPGPSDLDEVPAVLLVETRPGDA